MTDTDTDTEQLCGAGCGNPVNDPDDLYCGGYDCREFVFTGDKCGYLFCVRHSDGTCRLCGFLGLQ